MLIGRVPFQAGSRGFPISASRSRPLGKVRSQAMQSLIPLHFFNSLGQKEEAIIMMTQKLSLLFIAAVASAAVAQQSGPMDGKWSGTLKTRDGHEVATVLVVSAAGSTWQMLTQGATKGQRNPCREKQFPVTVTSQSASELALEIRGASVIKGCIDTKGVLKSTDGKTLHGTLEDGKEINLSRK